jgi:membrane protein YqaA with SNARE-associated domain
VSTSALPLEVLELAAIAAETASPLISDLSKELASIVTAFLDAAVHAVETATGWTGLGIVFVYSFLIAFILPGPSEIVLVAPLELGLSGTATLALIVLVSAVGKTVGSVVAFRVGQGVKHSDPVVQRLRRSRFNVIEWSEKQTVRIARKWGYAGLALALSVPFFPDTVSIYAFAVLEEDDLKFAMATFAGSLGRFLVVLALIGGPATLL